MEAEFQLAPSGAQSGLDRVKKSFGIQPEINLVYFRGMLEEFAKFLAKNLPMCY